MIAYFNQHYLATEIFPKYFSKIIRNASLLRNSSDYDDFYLCSKVDTVELVANAKIIVDALTEYVAHYWKVHS